LDSLPQSWAWKFKPGVPLHEGVFTGRPTNNPKFQKAAALVWDLSRKYLCSPESLVLSWLLLLPQAVRPVIGTTHMGRLDACRDAEKVRAHQTRLVQVMDDSPRSQPSLIPGFPWP
jgi:predicted oxidoreductase